MDKFFDSKFAKGLSVFGEKLAGNRYLGAVSGGLMGTMAIMMVGAVFQIIASLLVDVFKVIDSTSPLYTWLITPYNMTMGLMAVVVAFTMAYGLAKGFKMQAMQSGIISLVVFLVVAAPAQTVAVGTGPDGAPVTMTVLNTSNLGGTGLFTAIIVALISVRITKLIQDRRLYIRMPDVVPQFLTDAFAAMVPLLTNILLFHGLNWALQQVTDYDLPNGITQLLAKPFEGVTSIGGLIVLFLFALLFWVFGIHGTMVIMVVIMLPYMTSVLTNGALHDAGQPLQFAPVMLFMTIACVGGTGNTLGLVLLGLRSKSAQIKAVSRAALVPGFFNINEPVVFGFPIMYNPILAIPYLINPIILMLIAWAGYATEILKAPYIMMMALLPVGVGEYLSTLSWTNLLFPFIIALPVSTLIWFPFYKIYERQLVAKEAAAAEAEVVEVASVEA